MNTVGRSNDDRPYNPLDKRNLGVSVANALLAGPALPLPPEPSFTGAGVYAIYYLGPFPAYASIAAKNHDADKPLSAPIYVGKAIPAGGRRGGGGLSEGAGTVLFKRLREHSESIRQVSNLELDDFLCRYLVVDDIWIPLAEATLIRMFRPAWNGVIDGFGNHAPGKGRYEQQVSAWDTLHPGRPWAEKMTGAARSIRQIEETLATYLASQYEAEGNQ